MKQSTEILRRLGYSSLFLISLSLPLLFNNCGQGFKALTSGDIQQSSINQPTPPPTPLPSPSGNMQYVYFPQGNCTTGVLEVQLNGSLHSFFPQIQTGDCFREDVGLATTNLQVRCIDPSGVQIASDWVGPATNTIPTNSSVCARLLN